jgi:hypothetical protein
MRRITFFLLVFLSLPAMAEDGYCKKLDETVGQTEFHQPHTALVTGEGPLYFHTAPDEKCKNKAFFLMHGDRVSVYSRHGRYAEIFFFDENKNEARGWVLTERLKIIAKPDNPEVTPIAASPSPDKNLKFCDDWIGTWGMEPHGSALFRIEKQGDVYRVKQRPIEHHDDRYTVSSKEAWDSEAMKATPDPGSTMFHGGHYADGSCSLKVMGGFFVKVQPGDRYEVTSSGGNGNPFEIKTAKSGYLFYRTRGYFTDGIDLYSLEEKKQISRGVFHLGIIHLTCNLLRGI